MSNLPASIEACNPNQAETEDGQRNQAKQRNCKYLHTQNVYKKIVFKTLLACSDVALLVASLAKTARDFWLLSAVTCMSEPTRVPSYSEGKRNGNQQYF